MSDEQPSGTTIRKRVEISGRVQGVWFRGATEREAKRLGVTGWVRNRPDGSVEAVFEGTAAAVGEILAWCQHGPTAARVESVRAHEEPPEHPTGFEITY